MKYLIFLFLFLFLIGGSPFAQEESISPPVGKEGTDIPIVKEDINTLNTPVVSGEIIDEINLPLPDKAIIYLMIQDKEARVWSCKIEDAKLLEEVEKYKIGEYVDIYGVIINQEGRQVEAKQIEKQHLNNEE